MRSLLRISLSLPTLGLIALLGTSGAASAQEGASQSGYPHTTAIAAGISPAGLDRVDQLARELAESGEVVGSELLVLVNGKAVLHQGYGLRDQETKQPMGTGNVFCVRSMTKPVIGTAILMLVDERKLKLSDRVAEYLPALDVEGWQDVTLEHLITHTTGLPFSLIAGRSLDSLGDIQQVAALGADFQLEFEPGSAFQYSDQGTDTLTAVIEVVSGMSAAEFVTSRILEPLGMDESACVLEMGSPLRNRALPLYLGESGAWTRFWGPDQPSIFPFFLGSQGLYATLGDYARFLDLWMSRGRAGGERLLKSSSVRKALRPNEFGLPAGSGFSKLEPGYGYLMQLWTEPPAEEGGKHELIAFGHNGSDGTYAWAFPEQKAMVMYFTQSRGNASGLRIEEALDNLFLGAPYNPNEAAPPLEPYLGYYQEDEEDLYRAIIRENDGLALEVRGKGVVPLVYMGEDRWKFRDNPSRVVAFQRAEDGGVSGFTLAGTQEYRFEPSADLPSVEEISARVAAYHHMELAAQLGALRMNGTLNIAKLNVKGQTTTFLEWPNRYRSDVVMDEGSEQTAYDGKDVRYASEATGLQVVDGLQAELMRNEHAFARFGNLVQWYPELHAVERLVEDGREIVLLRTRGTEGPAETFYVEVETGQVAMIDSLTFMPGIGRMGKRTKFQDYREVSGMRLPHRFVIQLPNPIIGEIVAQIDSIEVGVDVSEAAFRLEDL